MGTTGRNFAAGMSGGKAYVWRMDTGLVNTEMVDLAQLTDEEKATLHGLVEAHATQTDSPVAQALLDRWDEAATEFTAVIPRDYQRVLNAIELVREAGLDVEQNVMSVLSGELKLGS